MKILKAQDSRAVWSTEDKSHLLHYLADHVVEMGNGANFKKKTWEGAAAELAKRPSKGAPKTVGVCRSKWQKVSQTPAVYAEPLTLVLAQGSIYHC